LQVIMVAVRTLTPLELPRYRDHLLRLGADDRRLRFGFPIPDERIVNFVDGLRPLDTRVLVHTGPDLEVIGAVQMSMTSWRGVEFAFSVEAPFRGRGVATALFDRALLWARNRRIRQAYVQCLSENHAMRRIARKSGMAVQTETGESEGTLIIPGATPLTLFEELMAENNGVCDVMAKASHRTIAWFMPTAPVLG
jgi:RimJ/RimL family protein N-acetyltransferase